jgi:hypothetical protein
MADSRQWFRELRKKVLSQECRRRRSWRRHDLLLLERLEDRVVRTYIFSDLASFKGYSGDFPAQGWGPGRRWPPP